VLISLISPAINQVGRIKNWKSKSKSDALGQISIIMRHFGRNQRMPAFGNAAFGSLLAS
jgi:hypothetical protein